MNRMIRFTVLALALLPAFAFAQTRPAAVPIPGMGPADAGPARRIDHPAARALEQRIPTNARA